MKLYEYYASMSPVYKNGYSNHGPMMIGAYRQLGVDDKIIKERLDLYFSEKSIGDLGDKHYPQSSFEKRYVSRTNYYINQIKETSKEDVISSFLNQSLNALSSALFHGVIRLAYAVLADKELLIAQALAYFDLSKEELDIQYQEIDLEKWQEQINALITLRSKKGKITKDSSMDAFKELLEDKEISSSITVPTSFESLNLVVDTLAKRYLDTNDFYVLHTLTGFHAMMKLKEYFDDFNNALKEYLAHAQVFLILYKHDNYEQNSKPNLSIETLKSKAYKLTDSHDIKLFYTAYDLYQSYSLQSLHQICERLITKDDK